MSRIKQLETEIRGYKNKIQELQSEIKKNEQNYESLRIFKGNVEKSYEEFNNVNNAKKSQLTDIEMVKKNSITAQRYYDGMNNILNGIGTKTVVGAYLGLLFMISGKMQSYMNNINCCETKIKSYNGTIAGLDIALQDAKNNEKQGGNK
ncbi:hypothetical protein [Roseburia sp. 499]|uniref:hypothetical protein n=1 Tax=Roseburia sp. 499 TaxID=1261634 RepID=UPI0009514C79|nr:hypothetical protein [Roseburia sp. 499]WVK70852.1 hypothetical protein BIV20_04780 [Roseburia sp. 499]